jgi:hypothetical protein
MRILDFLETRRELSFKLLQVDATSVSDTKDMLSNLSHPVGAVIFLSTVLIDRLFMSHTSDDFSRSFKSKVGAYRVLEQCLNLADLDFVVLFSSVTGLLGNAGQTTYCR